MFLVKHDNGVGHDADHDRGHAVQHVGGEANGVAEAVAPELRQINPRTHSDRHSYNAGEGKDEAGADNGICHSAAGFAHRLRGLRQKSPVDRANATVDQIGENREQRHQHQNDGEHGYPGHDVVGDAPAQRNVRNGTLRRGFFDFRHVRSQAGRA